MYQVLSSEDVRKLKEGIDKGDDEVEVSLDLGISRTKVKLSKEGFYLDNQIIPVEKIRDVDKSCYVLLEGKLEKIQFASPETRLLYKLIPTLHRPILQVSGTSMHKRQFVERIEKERLKGKVLDAGTGLGYTAITASKTADKVVTFEIDENVLEVAKFNPYSVGLFESKNIERNIGDIVEKITLFKGGEFDSIIFDAGTPKSSRDFLSFENYTQAFRVLRKGGKLYHYLPEHHIQRGRDFGAEVIKRIKKAGFSLVERDIKGSYAILKKDR